MEGIVYIAHGSRKAFGNDKFISFIQNVMARVDYEIQNYGFLENASPSIFQALGQCIESGANELTIVPILLLPGIHATVDIPVEIQRFKKEHPEISIRYGAPLGADEVMVELLLERLRAKGFVEGGKEAVLLVGHGSREREAAGKLETLAGLLRERVGLPLEIGYLRSSPEYAQCAKAMLDIPAGTLFVLPFLLYSGDFIGEMESALALLAFEKEAEVVMCDPVGFDVALAPLVLKRIKEAKRI